MGRFSNEKNQIRNVYMDSIQIIAGFGDSDLEFVEHHKQFDTIEHSIVRKQIVCIFNDNWEFQIQCIRRMFFFTNTTFWRTAHTYEHKAHTKRKPYRSFIVREIRR